MQLGPVLDTAIGLALVYAMLSLFVTSIMEIIAAALNLRGKKLIAAIIEITEGLPGSPGEPGVAEHPLIRGAQSGRRPSYVEARNFARAVLDQLSALDPATTQANLQSEIAKISNDRVKTILSNLATTTGGKIGQLETEIGRWFDDVMDRVSGEYKRLSQIILILVGLVCAVAFNVSTIGVCQKLWQDSAAREAMVEAALAQQTTPVQSTTELADAQKQSKASRINVSKLPLPLGWSDKERELFVEESLWKHLLEAVGWLMTALAVSLGAPFWFDLLQRLINFRNTGPKPGAAKKQR